MEHFLTTKSKHRLTFFCSLHFLSIMVGFYITKLKIRLEFQPRFRQQNSKKTFSKKGKIHKMPFNSFSNRNGIWDNKPDGISQQKIPQWQQQLTAIVGIIVFYIFMKFHFRKVEVDCKESFVWLIVCFVANI